MISRSAHSLLDPFRQLVAEERRRRTSDGALLQAYLDHNDADAFAELLRRHGPMVWRLALHLLRHRQDAEDVFQAAFVTLARQARALRAETSLAAWLHRVTWRLSLRSRAASARQRRPPQRPLPFEEHDPAAEITVRESQELLHQELNALPERLRLPLVLCYLQGLTRDEAAARLGWSLGTLKRRLEAGRKRLHARLSRRGLALSALLSASLLAPAEVSASLAEGALRVAVSCAGGSLGMVPAPVAVLVAEISSSAKVKALWVLMLTLATFTAGAGAWVYHGQASEPAAPPPEARSPSDSPDARKVKEAQQPARDLFGDPLPAGAIARLGTVRLRHGDYLHALAFAPDGKTLISAGRDGMRVWQTATSRPVRHFGEPMFQPSVSLSPDGRRLAVARFYPGSGGPIEVWDVATGKLVHKLGDRHFTLVRFSPDGKHVAAFTGRSAPFAFANPWQIMIWDTATGRLINQLSGPADCVTAMTFTPDGKSLLLAGSDKAISFRDVTSGKEVRRIRDLPAEVHSLVLSPRGDRLAFIDAWSVKVGQQASWGSGTSAYLVDLRSGAELRHWKEDAPSGPEGAQLMGLAFSPDAKKLAVCSTNGPIRIWDADTGKEIRQLAEGVRRARAVAFSPDGRTLAVALDERVIHLVDLDSGVERVQTKGHRGSVTALAVAADGATVFAGAADGTIHRWDARTGRELDRLPGHTDRVTALALPDPGRVLWSRSYDETVRRWRPDSGEGRRVFHDLKGYYWLPFALSLDGGMLAMSSGYREVLVMRSATGEILQRLPTKTRLVTAAFTADSSVVTVLTGDRAICRWETATGQRLPDLLLPADPDVPPCDPDSWLAGELYGLSPDGRLVAHAYDDKFLRVLDVDAQREVHRQAKLPGNVSSLAFAQDGRTLAWAEQSGVIHWLELASGSERRTMPGHAGGVTQMIFTADGKRLISGSHDCTALVWDLLGSDKSPDVPLAGCWDTLADKDAAKAHWAMRRLIAAPAEALAQLSPRLKPAVGVDQRRTERCIADLDADEFAVREKAARELQQLDELAEPAIRKALESRPTLETRRRLRALLDDIVQHQWRPSAEGLRLVRAIEVLERIATSEARALLQSLARGAAGARMTREAQAALRRLNRLAEKP